MINEPPVTTGMPGPGENEDKNAVNDAASFVAYKKGAMYDYCILRAIEIVIPDKTVRAIMIDGGRPIAGLECKTLKDPLDPDSHVETILITFQDKEVIRAIIRSSIMPPDESHSTEWGLVQMLSLWSVDGNNTHIYV